MGLNFTGGSSSSDAGEGCIQLHLPVPFSTTQGTWSSVNDSVQINCAEFNNAGTNADGDQVNYKAYLAAGTYKAYMVYYRATNRGILDILVDGTSAVTFDCNGANAKNTVGITSAFTVATSGLKTIGLKVNGSTSGDHFMSINEIWLVRQT